MSVDFYEMLHKLTSRLNKYKEHILNKVEINLKLLQNDTQAIAKLRSANQELLERVNYQTASLEAEVAKIKDANRSADQDRAKLLRQIAEKETKLKTLESEINCCEAQKKALLDDFQNHCATLNRRRDALLTVNGYFKNRLELYLILNAPEDDTFTVAFFCTEKMPDYDFFVQMKWEEESKKWTLVDMKPKLACEAVLSKKLSETGDIQGFMFHVRKLFLRLKAKAKA